MRDCVLYISEEGLDERAKRLLHIGVSRGWSSRGPRGAQIAPALVVTGEGWDPTAWPGAATRSTGELALDEAARRYDRDGWGMVVNGRYALSYGERLLREAVAGSNADVVLVSVDNELVSYRERVLANREGRVLGFKRAYSDESAPAGVNGKSWQLLLVRRDATRPEGGNVKGDPGRTVATLKALGIRVEAVRIAGEAYDLASEEGLLRFLNAYGARRVRGEAAGEARIVGDATVEAGARLGRGAAVIGPALVCAGATVGDQATVSGAIVGPGAVVEEGATVRNAVVLAGEAGRVAAGARRGGPVTGRKRGVFREWPALSYARAGKRTLDIAGSIVALAILVTIFPIAAAAIKLNSKGPIFYAHRRQGLRGKEFLCLKFRTMGAETGVTREELRAINEVDGPQFKVEHDPRTTLVGEFLRETNIDEIPQFLNVLAGQMSIVGPRPSPDEENQMCPAWREARLSVKPGITGLWQVSRSADRKNDFQEWIYYDTEYVKTLSFWNDLGIIAKTVKVILGGFAQLFVAKRDAGKDSGT